MKNKTEITKCYEDDIYKCIVLTFISIENEKDKVCVQMTYKPKSQFDSKEEKYASLITNFVEMVIGLENNYYLAEETYLTKHLDKE